MQKQIISVWKEPEPGIKTVDVCRTHGILGSTLCKWKAKYGGADVLP
ncbi:transposase [Xanthobacter flavus]